MHEALRHAVSEFKSYFPYDTISATQVGFSTVQLHMPEESLNDLVFLLNKTEDADELRRELAAAEARIYDLDVEADNLAANAADDNLIADETINSLSRKVESLERSLASARRQMDYWMDELESHDIEVRPPRV